MKVSLKKMKPLVDQLFAFDLNDKGELNPYQHDEYHMGSRIGEHLELMYANHPSEPCKYLILVNRLTGGRVHIQIDWVTPRPTLKEKLRSYITSFFLKSC